MKDSDPKNHGQLPNKPAATNPLNLLAGVGIPMRDVIIVLAAFLTLGTLSAFVIDHYATAADATSTLGVAIPAISTIAAAAFGISTGVAAGSQMNRADKEAAERKANDKARDAADVKDQVSDLRQTIKPIFDMIQRLPSPAGQRSFRLTATEVAGLDPPIEIDTETLASVRERLAEIETSLARTAER